MVLPRLPLLIAPVLLLLASSCGPSAGEPCWEEGEATCGGRRHALVCEGGFWLTVDCPGGCSSHPHSLSGIECSLSGADLGDDCVPFAWTNGMEGGREYCGTHGYRLSCRATGGSVGEAVCRAHAAGTVPAPTPCNATQVCVQDEEVCYDENGEECPRDHRGRLQCEEVLGCNIFTRCVSESNL